MSAFMVNNETINAILQGRRFGSYPGNALRYRWKDESRPFEGATKRIGQVLVGECRRSVNYRYDLDTKPYAFQPIHDRDYTPVEVIKLCHCYSYQSCETPDWEETEAYTIVEALRERAIRNLPGYDEAPWEL